MTPAPDRTTLAAALLLALAAAAASAEDVTPPATPAAAPAPSAVPAGERDEAYKAFRADFDAGRYTEALPHAEAVVKLSEAGDAPALELARALGNLGSTNYALGDYIAAEQAYGRSLALVEQSRGAAAPELVPPLRGLAQTYHGGGHDEVAVPILERAVAIVRRSLGLFDPQQHDLLATLAQAYTATGRYADADRAEDYLLKVAEHQYGPEDQRILPALQRLAEWRTLRHETMEGRLLWTRMLALASQRPKPSFGGRIRALRGMAFSYRVDYQYGPEPVTEENLRLAQEERLPIEMRRTDAMGQPALGPAGGGGGYFLDSQGRERLEEALALAEKADPAQPIALLAVLLDLGDWQMVAEHTADALALYRRALPLVPPDLGTAEGEIAPFAAPVRLLYRHPPSALRHRDAAANTVDEKFAVAEFTVGADGRVHDVVIAEGDATDSERSSFTSALQHAIYRPRFVAGQPVASEKIRYRETFRTPKK